MFGVLVADSLQENLSSLSLPVSHCSSILSLLPPQQTVTSREGIYFNTAFATGSSELASTFFSSSCIEIYV